MECDLKDVVGVLMRVLDGGESPIFGTPMAFAWLFVTTYVRKTAIESTLRFQ
jgi:hypothetical protein